MDRPGGNHIDLAQQDRLITAPYLRRYA